MTEEETTSNDKKLCECGCGTLIPTINKHGSGQLARFKHGHNLDHSLGKTAWNKGRTGIYSAETRAKMSAGAKGKPKPDIRGSNHHKWNADNPSYRAIHHYIRKYYPPPNACQDCGKIAKLELSNITRIYDRDPSNYRYQCISCHRLLDRHKRKVCGVNARELIRLIGTRAFNALSNVD
jgi:hypothetical protein